MCIRFYSGLATCVAFGEEVVRDLVSELSELVWLKSFVPSGVCPRGIVENQRAERVTVIQLFDRMEAEMIVLVASVMRYWRIEPIRLSSMKADVQTFVTCWCIDRLLSIVWHPRFFLTWLENVMSAHPTVIENGTVSIDRSISQTDNQSINEASKQAINQSIN